MPLIAQARRYRHMGRGAGRDDLGLTPWGGGRWQLVHTNMIGLAISHFQCYAA